MAGARIKPQKDGYKKGRKTGALLA